MTQTNHFCSLSVLPGLNKQNKDPDVPLRCAILLFGSGGEGIWQIASRTPCTVTKKGLLGKNEMGEKS